MEKNYKYDAFISYRHVSPDKAVADKLQKMLENYRPPKNVGKNRKKWHIFRDETELPTSSNLGNDIKEALESSEFLIVICSKTTAQSRWCMDEIRYFKELHNGNNAKILTLVADGTPEQVFPPELCNELVPVSDADGNITYVNRLIEPLAANVSSASEKQALKKLKTEFLRIAAPILGCSYDSLYNREQKKKLRRMLAVGSAVVASLLLFSLYNGAMLLKINRQNEDLLKANKELNIKNSEILTNQAEIYYNNGNDPFAAIETALAAMPQDETLPENIKAERIISELTGVFRNDSSMFCTTVNLSGYVNSLDFSKDGRRIVARDSNGNIYLIDAEKNEILKAFLFKDLFGAETSGISSKMHIGAKKVYVLFGNKCVAFSLETGDILWEYEGERFSDYHELAANDTAGRIFLAGYDSYVILDDDGSVIFSGNDENGNYSYSILDVCLFMASDGTVYICNSRNGTVCGIKEGSSAVVFEGLSGSPKLISAYETEDSLCFACKTEDKKIHVIYFDKEDFSLKWEREYDTDTYVGASGVSMFEFAHSVETDGEYVLKTAVLFRNGREIKAFDIENGEQYYSFCLDEDVLYFEPNTTSYTLRVATPESFMTRMALLKGGSALSDVDSAVAFESYSFDKKRKFASFDGENVFALASENSSEISIYGKISFDSYTGLDSSLPTGSVYHTADGGNGIFAAGFSNNRVIIYDVNANKLLSDTVSGVDVNINGMIFVGGKLFVYDSNGKGYLFDNNGERSGLFELKVLVSEKLREQGNSTYVNCYDSKTADLGGKLAFCTPEGLFAFDISEEESVEIIKLNGKNESFAAISADSGGISCAVRNSSEKSETLAFFDKDFEMSYITENGEALTLPEGSVTLTAHSENGDLFAFVNGSGYIGMFDAAEEKLVKLPYDTERLSPLRLAVSPNAEYVFVLGTDGKLIRYSAETFDETDCMLDIKVDSRNTALHFCDSDTLFVTCGPSSSYPGTLVDITAMEKRAGIDEVVLAPENTGKIVFSSYSKGWGYYNILKGKELTDFAEAFVEKNK